MAAIIYVKNAFEDPLTPEQKLLFKTHLDLVNTWVNAAEEAVELTPEQQKEFDKQIGQAVGWAKSLGFKPEMEAEMGFNPESFAHAVLLHAIKTYDSSKGMAFTSWLYRIMEQQAANLWNKYKRYLDDTGGGERSLAEPIPTPSGETVELEQLLEGVEQLRLQDDPAYNILRSKLREKLKEIDPTERLFRIYRLLVEEGLSNPQVAAAENLSPSRITGLQKKIENVLLQFPEIKEALEVKEQRSSLQITDGSSSTSILRRFIFRVGDRVRVRSIEKVGIITSVYQGGIYDIQLEHNSNFTRTIREDVEKYSTIVESANKVLSHFFNARIRVPQCYAARFFKGEKPDIAILELRPTSEESVVAKLYIGNNLVGASEVSRNKSGELILLLKSYIGVESKLDPNFVVI